MPRTAKHQPRARRRMRPRFWAFAGVVAVVACGVFFAPLASLQPLKTAAPDRLQFPASHLHFTTTAGSSEIQIAGGPVLYAKNAGKERPIASTTKIMTAFLVLRNKKIRLSEPVAISSEETLNDRDGVLKGDSEVPLKTGQVVSVQDLVYALLLPSADDSAWTLANVATGGHSSAFVSEMNSEAKKLGMNHTHYVDPDGVSRDSESSARDLMKLTVQAMKISEFRTVVRTKTRMTPFGQLTNLNLMLWQYPGTIGVKTGWTPWAGSCLVFGATRSVDGHPLTVYGVVLGEPSFDPMFGDTEQLMQTAFSLHWHTVVPAHSTVATVRLNTAFGHRTYMFRTTRALGGFADGESAHLQFHWSYSSKGWNQNEIVGKVRLLARGFAPSPWVNVEARSSFHQPWWGGL